MLKFKIEKGIQPGKRGPKPKIDYDGLFPLLDKMDVNDSIRITEVPLSRRNSTYLTITEVFGRRLDKNEDNNNIFEKGTGKGKKVFEVKSSKIGDKVELRVFRTE